MAATLLLVLLVVVGAAQAGGPPPCRGDPKSWCLDTAAAAPCEREQQCRDLRDSPALQDVPKGDDEADGDDVAPGRRNKCSLCTKVMKKLKKLMGDDPDEEAVAAALKKGCRPLGRLLGKLCQKMVDKYRDQISQELQDGDSPQAICTAIGICKA